MQRHLAKQTTDKRRGGILVMVAISLLLMTVIAGILTRAVVTQREYARSGVLRTQAEWLAQSAARRAVAKLAGNSEYTGETWNISADELDQESGATAEIVVAATEAGSREVRVTVLYPPEGERRVKLTDEFPLVSK